MKSTPTDRQDAGSGFAARRRRSILPGFGLTMGISMLYLGLLVLIPLSTVFFNTLSMRWSEFWAAVSQPRVVASYRISFGTALAAAFINMVFGFLVAWVLTRYQFPGRKLIDGLVDLPFALPTAVAGITLTTLYAENGWIGKWLAELGIKVSFTPLGITLALVFVTLPFVVRTVQPVILQLEKETEEAAAMLGAYRFRTFVQVIFPELLPALLTGFTLALARGLGEYGSIVFISGNLPMRTEITPLLIRTKLEQYDYEGATAVALVMLIASFVLLFAINVLQWRTSRRLRSDI
jgi:sulfate transport system permease protein